MSGSTVVSAAVASKPNTGIPQAAAGGAPAPAAPAEPQGEILLYRTEDGRTRVECRFADESLWLSQALIAELFQKDVRTINEHLKNLYRECELDTEGTIRKFRIVRTEGTRQVVRQIEHYNLDAILAVGYRVRSPRGTQFRRWATERLREYLVKGFTMDDERLKRPPAPGLGVPDYFDELLERIRDIRASEARMYLRVREIFALAADYDPSDKDTTTFFQIMQNKLHYAATGRTAAELVAERADHARPNMGLTSWKGGRVAKNDVRIAKNYLAADEISELNRIVVMWLDFAEDQARRRKQVFLKDWQTRLDEFLRFNERDVLGGAGKVSHQEAMDRAEAEYERFAARRRVLLEAQGERDGVAALEAASKRLEGGEKQPGRERRKGE
ncbi:MAG: virulence RhuM family protein [bacterium]|nr:virulence RhuM family protein [bacterium]